MIDWSPFKGSNNTVMEGRGGTVTVGKKYAEARKEVKGSWHCENGSSVLKKLQKNCEVSQYVKPEKKQKKKREIGEPLTQAQKP